MISQIVAAAVLTANVYSGAIQDTEFNSCAFVTDSHLVVRAIDKNGRWLLYGLDIELKEVTLLFTAEPGEKFGFTPAGDRSHCYVSVDTTERPKQYRNFVIYLDQSLGSLKFEPVPEFSPGFVYTLYFDQETNCHYYAEPYADGLGAIYYSHSDEKKLLFDSPNWYPKLYEPAVVVALNGGDPMLVVLEKGPKLKERLSYYCGGELRVLETMNRVKSLRLDSRDDLRIWSTELFVGADGLNKHVLDTIPIDSLSCDANEITGRERQEIIRSDPFDDGGPHLIQVSEQHYIVARGDEVPETTTFIDSANTTIAEVAYRDRLRATAVGDSGLRFALIHDEHVIIWDAENEFAEPKLSMKLGEFPGLR